jgi:hypothetical protein
MKQNGVKNILKGGLIAFLIATNALFAAAIEREGVVVAKVENHMGLNIRIRVDGNRPFDHVITIGGYNLVREIGIGLDMMTERGTRIRFEDEGMRLSNGIMHGFDNQILRVNDVCILDMFPGNENYFQHAVRARNNATFQRGTSKNKSEKVAFANARHDVLPVYSRSKGKHNGR